MITEIKEAIITERQDGIVHVHFKENTDIGVELLEKLYSIYFKICADTKKPFLFTGSENVSINKEAREKSIIMEAVYPGLASAVIATSTPHKLLANLYLLINKPKLPYKVFLDEEKAVEWLSTFLIPVAVHKNVMEDAKP